MKTWPFNYHTHSNFSDGTCTLRDQVEQAVANGVRVLGISDHAPLGAEHAWTMVEGRLGEYRAKLESLRAEFTGRLELLIGLEVDWLPEQGQWLQRVQSLSWDYSIGSVHYVATAGGLWAVDADPQRFERGVSALFGGDIRAASAAFFQREQAAAASGRFDVLGHVDLVKKFNRNGAYFDEDEAWYRDLVEPVVEAAAKSGVIVEVNTAGLDKPVGEFYPSPWIVQRCLHHGVRLGMNSDSHEPQTLQRHFDAVLPRLVDLGVRELWRREDGRWSPAPLTA